MATIKFFLSIWHFPDYVIHRAWIHFYLAPMPERRKHLGTTRMEATHLAGNGFSQCSMASRADGRIREVRLGYATLITVVKKAKWYCSTVPQFQTLGSRR